MISRQVTAGKPHSVHPAGCTQSILTTVWPAPSPREGSAGSLNQGCSSPRAEAYPAGTAGLSPTKPLKDGDHPQPDCEALPSPLKPCEGLSWSQPCCRLVALCWHWRPGQHRAASPMCVQCPGSQQLPGFYQHPYQFPSLPRFFKPSTAPSGTLPQPPPAAPKHQHLSRISSSGKAPVLRDTSSDVLSASSVPSSQAYASLPQLFTTIPTIFHHHLSF